MQRLKAALSRWMIGRYGIDELYRFHLYILLALLILQVITKWSWLSIAIWFLLIYALFRIFSRNIMARRLENQKYLKVRNGFLGEIQLTRDKFRDRKTRVYRKCPQCKAVIRLPKKKGRHSVTCPRCQHTFQVKI